jgi:hypothetical protein
MRKLALAALAVGALSALSAAPAEARWHGGPRVGLRPRCRCSGFRCSGGCIAVLLWPRVLLWSGLLPPRPVRVLRSSSLLRTAFLRPSLLASPLLALNKHEAP